MNRNYSGDREYINTVTRTLVETAGRGEKIFSGDVEMAKILIQAKIAEMLIDIAETLNNAK